MGVMGFTGSRLTVFIEPSQSLFEQDRDSIRAGCAFVPCRLLSEATRPVCRSRPGTTPTPAHSASVSRYSFSVSKELTWGFIPCHTICRTFARERVCPFFRTTHAPTASPYFASGTETAEASAIAGCASRTFSICTGNRFSPPRTMMS
jgi:hypothetical protein